MKALIWTVKQRVALFSDLAVLPADWVLVYLPPDAAENEVLAAAADADFIFADAIRPISGNLIRSMPNLKCIHSEGVAFNAIDVAAATERGVYVCNNPGVNAGAVAEQTILLMLAVLRHFTEGETMLRAGRQMELKTALSLGKLHELGSCHVGLVGLGAIGKATAKLLRAFGCKVSYYNRHQADAETEKELQLSYLSLTELLSSCDIISLHVPVTPDTTHMICRTTLAQMKPSSILINTARGDLVCQQDLRDAILSGQIAGAGLDTLSPEPVTIDNPLLQLPEEYRYRILFSPHVGGTTAQAFQTAHKNVWNAFLAVSRGEKPLHRVNL